MRHIIVTLPSNRAEWICQKISAQGDNPISCPLLTIVPEPKHSKEFHRLKNDLEILDDLIFISPSAVSIAAPVLSQSEHKMRLIATGRGTAEAIQKLNLQKNHDLGDIIYPSYPNGGEALCSLDSLKDIKDRRIGIIKGQGGREIIEDTLSDRGASISTYCLYQRIPTPDDHLPLEKIHQLVLKQNIHAVIISSSEAMMQFMELIQRAFDHLTEIILKETILIVTHPRIEQLAIQCGFSTTVVANHEEVLETLYNRLVMDRCNIG